MSARRIIAGLSLALSAAACVPDEGPAMRPGEDCLVCHNGNDARQWTVAGTIFADPNADATQGQEGIDVVITGNDLHVLTLKSNSAGNFYTAEPIAFPITVVAQRGGVLMGMVAQQDYGGCNSCHFPGNTEGAPGHVFVPFTASAARASPHLLRTALRSKNSKPG